VSERRGFLDRLLGDEEPSIDALRKEVARQSERAALAEQGLERAQTALRNTRDELATARAILGREQKEARTQRERAEGLQGSALELRAAIDVLTDLVAELAARDLDLLGSGSVQAVGFRALPLPTLADVLIRLGVVVSVEVTPERLTFTVSPETHARPGLARLLAGLIAATHGRRVCGGGDEGFTLTLRLEPMEQP